MTQTLITKSSVQISLSVAQTFLDSFSLNTLLTAFSLNTLLTAYQQMTILTKNDFNFTPKSSTSSQSATAKFNHMTQYRVRYSKGPLFQKSIVQICATVLSFGLSLGLGIALGLVGIVDFRNSKPSK